MFFLNAARLIWSQIIDRGAKIMYALFSCSLCPQGTEPAQAPDMGGRWVCSQWGAVRALRLWQEETRPGSWAPWLALVTWSLGTIEGSSFFPYFSHLGNRANYCSFPPWYWCVDQNKDKRLMYTSKGHRKGVCNYDFPLCNCVVQHRGHRYLYEKSNLFLGKFFLIYRTKAT